MMEDRTMRESLEVGLAEMLMEMMQTSNKTLSPTRVARQLLLAKRRKRRRLLMDNLVLLWTSLSWMRNQSRSWLSLCSL